MSHYQRLGVAPDADTAVIRDAYRRLARLHHPDARGGAASPEMASINEAYAVLSDPVRRLDYDRALRAGGIGSAAGPGGASATAGARTPDPRLLTLTEPPRFPWRFVLALVVLGAVAVLTVGAFTDPGAPTPIDNVIQVGSCVVIDQTLGEVSEVRCEEPHDAVVEAFVPFDGRCPSALESFRDRQGLGVACVRRV